MAWSGSRSTTPLKTTPPREVAGRCASSSAPSLIVTALPSSRARSTTAPRRLDAVRRCSRHGQHARERTLATVGVQKSPPF